MVAHPLRRFLLCFGTGAPAALVLAFSIFFATGAARAGSPPAGPALLARTYCIHPAAPIPDGDGSAVDSTLLLTTPLRLSSLRLWLTATHPWPGDLSFTLSHAESGRQITLVDRPGVPATPYGCAADDVSAYLDDDATQPVEDVCLPEPPAIAGHLAPDEPLATFSGQLLAGTWTLSARDHEPGQSGTFDSWCLVGTGIVPPLASVAPQHLTTDQAPGQTVTRTLLLANAGGESLIWQLGPAAAAPGTPALSPTIVLSQSFEGGSFPPPGWTISTTVVTPTWALTPHTGRGWVAQGGQPDSPWSLDAWLLAPPLTLTAGTLTFWSAGSVYWCRDNDNRCDLDLWLLPESGEPIFLTRVDDTWEGEFTWTRQEIHLDSLLPDGPVRIAFRYRGHESAVLLDEVQVTLPPSPPALCHVGGAVPWLTWAPAGGNLDPGATQPLTLTLSAGGLAEGTYTATLCLESNDPLTPALPLPLTMTVGGCALEPAVAVPLTATRAGDDLLLAWRSLPANRQYEIHRSPSPFFLPAAATRRALLPGTATAYPDQQAFADLPAAFYRVRAFNCAAGLPADSDPVGFFTFFLH